MQAKYAMVAAGLLSLLATGQALGADQTAAGLWQSVDDDTKEPTGWFLIRDDGAAYDGSIVKMYLKPGEDPNAVCSKCTDDRHNKPWLGLEIIRGMKRNGNKYSDGTILDPRYGRIYSAEMTLSPDGQTLTVRGYLGISLLGQNQYWTRLPPSAFNEIDQRFNPNPAAAAPASGKKSAPPKPKQ
jgi:uncharacterized protein (DUF2147 family)